MQFTRAIAIALIASISGLQAANAMSLRGDGKPAEYPSSSFKGNQYVDSRGCVFVRAGVNSGTNWVPRVTRDRKLVCGFKPTLTAEQRQSTSAPTEVVKITLEPTAAPKPIAKPVVMAKPKPAPVRVVPAQKPLSALKTTAAPVKVVAAPSRTIAVKPHQPKADPMPKVVTSSVFSSRPERMFNAKPRRGDIVYEGFVDGDVRVVPKHVYEQRQNTKVKIPKGYRTVWKDDRLNPHRAEQTFNGKAKMDAIWTQTVPRRLISKPAG